jgi:hypothetical protein
VCFEDRESRGRAKGENFDGVLDLDGLDWEKSDWVFLANSDHGDLEFDNWGLCDDGEFDMRRNDSVCVEKNWFGYRGVTLSGLSDEFGILVYEMMARKFGVDENFAKAVEHLQISRYRVVE